MGVLSHVRDFCDLPTAATGEDVALMTQRIHGASVLLTSNIVNFSTMFSDSDSVKLLKDYILCLQ